MALDPTPLQHRLASRLAAAIYAIIDVFIPVIQTIEKTPTRSWTQRTQLAARFWTILRELLALTPRIDPATLSLRPAFPASLPSRARTAERAEAAVGSRQPKARPERSNPAAPLSARQLAKRVAALIQKLLALAAEAATTLPAPIHHAIARARRFAGCNALPPRYPTWERAG